KADVLLGALGADNNGRVESGSAYVVFGKSDAKRVDLAALGAGGFRIDGASSDSSTGVFVTGAGDVNADGKPDLAVGTYRSAYAVFGKSPTANIDLQTFGDQGFQIDGPIDSLAGVGDVNGDGNADVLVGG